MRRRDFITLLGGAAALAARCARAAGRLRAARWSVLGGEFGRRGRAGARYCFRAGAAGIRLDRRRNPRIDTRWGGGDAEGYRRHAEELVALAPDVLLAPSSAVVDALLRVTRDVPIVFTNVVDPVGDRFVANLARPGGNTTGFAAFEYGISGKWLALLKQIAPGITRAAVLRDAAITGGIGQLAAIQAMAPSPGVEASPLDLRADSEIEHAVAAFARCRTAV